MTTAPRKTKAATAKSSPRDLPKDVPTPAVDAPNATGELAKLPVLKMKDLIAEVARASGTRPAMVKKAVEATVQVLGDALHQGRGINLPGFGKAKVARGGAGKPLTVKLKKGTEKLRPKPAQEALAEDKD